MVTLSNQPPICFDHRCSRGSAGNKIACPVRARSTLPRVSPNRSFPSWPQTTSKTFVRSIALGPARLLLKKVSDGTPLRSGQHVRSLLPSSYSSARIIVLLTHTTNADLPQFGCRGNSTSPFWILPAGKVRSTVLLLSPFIDVRIVCTA